MFCSLIEQVLNSVRLPSKTIKNTKTCSEPVSFLHFWLGNVLRATLVCTFSCFFKISTSKRGPSMGVAHFGFELCFAKQRPATFNFDHREPQIIGNFGVWWLQHLFVHRDHRDLLSSETFSSLISFLLLLSSLPCFFPALLLYLSIYCRKFDF